jgi:lysophospholipase L1-like esterase
MKTKRFARLFSLNLLILAGIAPLRGQDASSASKKVTASRFTDGDRWCVLGDSITHAGSYHKDVELFYLTRYPDKKLEVINCGIAGDSAEGALKRLGWDCLSNRPTVVSLMLGMNDVKGVLYASNPDPAIMEKRKAANAAYGTNMTTLCSRIVGGGARLILITPSPYDDTAADSDTLKFASNHPGQAEALRGYAGRVKELGSILGVPVVDFNIPMSTITAMHQKTNSSFTLIGKDRVHPGPVGHLVMAYEFLKAQGVDGTVSVMTVDASGGRDLGSSNCSISDIKTGGEGVSFRCLEKSLPYPLTKEQQPALELIPFIREFNMETLRIAGLPQGDYVLTIDDRKIRNYSAAQLNEGVNLALETNTPQALQSAEVLASLGKKWVGADKIRTIVFNEFYALPDAPRPLTDATYVLQKYEEKLAASKSTNTYFTKIREHYLEYKSREAGDHREIQDALEQARKVAIPREHTFLVTKAPVP